MWECGLKPEEIYIPELAKEVTPYVGVWIETQRVVRWLTCLPVTPYVGVWIETEYHRLQRFRNLCHSLCGSVD